LLESFDVDSLRADILAWTVYDNIPFDKVESLHFRKILSRIHPFVDKSVIPTSRTTLRWLLRELLLHKEDIWKVLKQAISQIHLSFDLWTSPARKAMNGITAHFVDKKGHCRTVLLALTEMDDRHSGKNIAANTLLVIKDFSFKGNVGYFVLDNAYSNDTAVDELAAALGFDPIP
jgi:hypothetical protein